MKRHTANLATPAEAHAYLGELFAGENAAAVPVEDREEHINRLARLEVQPHKKPPAPSA